MMHLILAAALSAGRPDYAALMKAANIPGMEVVVVDHGRVVSNRAFGVKNVRTQAPVDVHTRFEIGSITKQITAAAILQLRDAGKLSLDDPLGKYVPQYVQGRKITLREMLLQISGIPNYTEAKAFGKLLRERNGTYTLSKPGSLDGVLALLEPEKLDFAPGTKWEYSNSNYYLLGRVIEIASGMPWQTYIARHIFKPAGMTESSFMSDEPKIADMASGYMRGKHGIGVAGSFNGWAGGAGAIVSTAADVAKWDAALFGGKIVSKADVALMTAPGRFPAPDKHARYGFGWVIDTYDGQPRIWHNGGTLGFGSSNQLYPKSQQAIIVLVNFGSADAIAQKTYDALHPKLAAARNIPALGEDPAVTARVQSAWRQLLSGHPDRTQFTGAFDKAMTPQLLAQAKMQLAPLGNPVSWIYRRKDTQHGATAYTYRVNFSSGTMLHVHMTLGKDGKISAYWFGT